MGSLGAVGRGVMKQDYKDRRSSFKARDIQKEWQIAQQA